MGVRRAWAKKEAGKADSHYHRIVRKAKENWADMDREGLRAQGYF